MDTTAPLLVARNLSHSYLEKPLFEGLNFSIHEGDRIGLLGVNGAGKSTLLSILAGTLKPLSGERHLQRDIRMGVLSQDFTGTSDDTVKSFANKAFDWIQSAEDRLHEIEHQISTAGEDELNRILEEQAHLNEFLLESGAWERDTQRKSVLSALGLEDNDKPVTQLSGGERRRLSLARVLLEKPDLLLLDEPTNHLDAETLDWLEDNLDRSCKSLVMVTHDRYFLDRITNQTAELSFGNLKYYQGNYTDYLVAKETEDMLTEQKEHHRQRYLRGELEWMRRQPKARGTKSKSRLQAIDAVLKEGPPARRETASVLLPDPPRLGKTIIEAECISKSIAGQELFSKLDFMIAPKDKIGIVGRNGTGKTTFLKTVLKEMEPDSGTVLHGPNLEVLYADQHRASLDINLSVIDNVAGDIEWISIGGMRISVKQYLRRYLFRDDQFPIPVNLLSGGERNRLLLAKLLLKGGNLLVLDEPTNDLDLQTLRVLEDSLVDFEGCALIVSHDRYFLNRIVNKMLWFAGDGDVHLITGNYDDLLLYQEKWRASKAEEKLQAAQKPEPVQQQEEVKPKGKKLSFKEKRELETMEETILQLESDLEEAEALLADPETYTSRSGDEISKLEQNRQALAQKVESTYERWTELNERAT